MDSTLENKFLKKLLTSRQGQINALLELTKAVNSNFSKGALLKLFEFILIDQFNINKMVLFLREEEWEVHLNIGNEKIANKIDVHTDLIKFGVVQDVRNYPKDTFKHFDFIIPSVHKKTPLAYLLIGGMRIEEYDSVDDNLKFIDTICSFIVSSLENKRLFKMQLEKEKINKEMELASQVQNMLIPTDLPKNEYLSVAGFYQPYSGIGGDYYDFISIDDYNVAFCMCDVSGKGISAGMLMANFQAQLRSLVNKYSSLEQLVDHLNFKMFEITQGNRFITMFLGFFDFTNRKLKFINAGHNPSLLFQNGEIISLNDGCTIIGAFDNIPRITVGEIVLEKNALILSYTDGLSELEDELGNQFGIDKLNEFLFKNGHLNEDQIIDNLIESLHDFKGDKDFNDDISVLINRFY